MKEIRPEQSTWKNKSWTLVFQDVFHTSTQFCSCTHKFSRSHIAAPASLWQSCISVVMYADGWSLRFGADQHISCVYNSGLGAVWETQNISKFKQNCNQTLQVSLQWCSCIWSTVGVTLVQFQKKHPKLQQKLKTDCAPSQVSKSIQVADLADPHASLCR